MIYIVNFSGGLSSFEALRRTLEKHGKDKTVAVFADVRGDASRDTHAAPVGTNADGEDDDVYRFIADAEKLLGVEVKRVHHPEGIGVWGAIFRERAISIMMAGGRFAPCTKLLKQQTLDAFHESLGCAFAVVTGLGWTEQHRVDKIMARIPNSWHPLTEAPFTGNCQIASYLRERGIEPPQSYTQGYPHANCGGACIKGGIANWALLLKTNPARYRYNEEQEGMFRRDVNPNVSILKDRRGGTTQPLPLRVLRERLESGDTSYDRHEWGGCGCFAQAMLGLD